MTQIGGSDDLEYNTREVYLEQIKQEIDDQTEIFGSKIEVVYDAEGTDTQISSEELSEKSTESDDQIL